VVLFIDKIVNGMQKNKNQKSKTLTAM